MQLFPIAIEQFNLTDYDLVLSSSTSVAKGVLTNHNQLHICYCHSPMRYAWDFYHDYLNNMNLTRGLKGFYAQYVLKKIRVWDIISSGRVDHFIANSHYIKQRIKKIYNRDSVVIYPPVNVNRFDYQSNKDEYYFTSSRLVPYKQVKLIAQAFNQMPDKKLLIAGEGPDYNNIKSIAKKNIEFLGFLKQEELNKYMGSARAFVFASEEDFGINPVEAQACGTPIIGLGKGGLLETVENKKTGLFFYEQKQESIIRAVKEFESMDFDYEVIRDFSLKFSKERFEEEFKQYVINQYDLFKNKSI